MTNAEKFKHLFGIYATELWAMPESDFLEWLNADAQDMPTGKWIPCSERLPKKAGHYLCSFETPRRIDNIYVDVAYWTGGMWYGVGKIIAWMPLPAPYRKDGD